MDDLAKRAAEHIDELKAVVDRYQGEAIGVDAKAHGLEQRDDIGAGGVPVAVVRSAELAIISVFKALAARAGPVGSIVAGKPPNGGEMLGQS